MQAMSAGVTRAGTGVDGIVWNILGQTYVPKQVSEQSFAWHATFPIGTFVPPHIHPTQDEFIYMFEGRLDCVIDGREFFATAGDLIRLPMAIAHGLFNKTDQPVKCLFWVTPTRRLYDLFWAIPLHEGAEARRGGGARRQARSGVSAAAALIRAACHAGRTCSGRLDGGEPVHLLLGEPGLGRVAAHDGLAGLVIQDRRRCR